jgi:two-component system response regulator
LLKEKPILMVEDNPDDEELTLIALGRCNLHNEIVVARDGAEALELLLGNKERPPMNPMPGLVLLDLMLPKIDGLEVLRHIRAHPTTRPLPVVLLTSSDEESDRARGYDLGVNSYVVKPVKMDSFVEAVGQLGMYWTLLNENGPDPERT